MNKEEKEQWLYEVYQYTSNFDFNRLDKYEEANDDICIDDLILDYTMLYEFHKEEIEKQEQEIERLNNIINKLENRDDVLEEFEDWLERQKTRNSEWDNFIMVDGRLGIPVSYLLNKLQELKGSDKE